MFIFVHELLIFMLKVLIWQMRNWKQYLFCVCVVHSTLDKSWTHFPDSSYNITIYQYLTLLSQPNMIAGLSKRPVHWSTVANVFFFHCSTDSSHADESISHHLLIRSDQCFGTNDEKACQPYELPSVFIVGYTNSPW